ncbi:MAG: hypothetical protein HDQ88_02200 [Clostridia bacterium]|nr:hypothetical protein [Clostridia bacterium]
MDFSEIEKRINYNFKDKTLLKRALTLASADAEDNNQTLEFFGDAILEFIVSEKIYSEEMSEGQLTERRKALVSDEALAPVSLKLGLDKFLVRGANDNKNKKAVPSVYEAVTASIYLDGGMEEAKKFVLSTLDFTANATPNYKGELQEYLQGKGEPCPVYERRDDGTPQNPQFTVTVKLYGRTFSGKGTTVKGTEQSVAKSVLEFIKQQKN